MKCYLADRTYRTLFLCPTLIIEDAGSIYSVPLVCTYVRHYVRPSVILLDSGQSFSFEEGKYHASFYCSTLKFV